MKTQNKNQAIAFIVIILFITLVFLITISRGSFKNNLSETKPKDKSAKKIELNLPKITAHDLLNKLNQINKTDRKDNLVILDVRSEDDYQEEHIIDSVNIPLSKLANQQVPANTSALVVILAKTAKQSSQAIEILKSKGFSNINVLTGGLSAWKDSFGQTVTWGDPTSFVNHAKINFITPEELKAVLDSRKGIFVLDVRKSTIFSPHIKGAVNIPLDQLEKRRKELPSNTEIIVYGQNELEGFNGGVILYDLNFISAYVLRGGFSAWKEKNYPVEN